MIKKRICSWDVGIKNLAYSIIEKEGNNYKIIDWDIVNLIEDMSFKCHEEQKNGKLCNKTAQFTGFLNGKTVNYCGTHKKYYNPLNDDWEEKEFNICKDNDKECEYLLPKKKIICGKKASFNHTKTDNHYCNVHRKLVTSQIIQDNSLKKIKKVKCNNLDVQVICQNIFEKLDKIPALIDVDEVYIENQPTLKNPTMKTIACMVFSYFVSRGIVNKESKKIDLVKFISPSNKIKVHEDHINDFVSKITDESDIYDIISSVLKELEKDLNLSLNEDKTEQTIRLIITCLVNKQILAKIKDENLAPLFNNKEGTTSNSFKKIVKAFEKHKKSYSITKKMAIEYTRYLIAGDKNNMNKLSKYNKKDDLCDAFLQGYYLLRK